MVEAIKKELEELEKEENQDNVEVQEDSEQDESVEQDDAVQDEDNQEAEAVEDAQDETEENDDDAEKLKKQEAYRERQRQKKEEAERRQAEAQRVLDSETSTRQQKQEAQDEKEEMRKALEEINQYRAQQQYQAMVERAKHEVKELEGEFREAFDDYDALVDQAMDISRMNLISKGYSEAQANAHLELEKVKIADLAAANGKDPIEAIYNEAKSINSWFTETAEKMGYTKATKPKTNLQAMREMAKPNAATGGKGKGANASRLTLEEMDDVEDINNLTLSEMRGLMDK